MSDWETLAGETPFDLSPLKVKGIATRVSRDGQYDPRRVSGGDQGRGSWRLRAALGPAPTFHADLVGVSQPQLLAFAVEGAGVDPQDAGRVFAAGAALEHEPDVFGFKLLEADGPADLDRSGEPSVC